MINFTYRWSCRRNRLVCFSFHGSRNNREKNAIVSSTIYLILASLIQFFPRFPEDGKISKKRVIAGIEEVQFICH
jgi:hypothetical protein